MTVTRQMQARPLEAPLGAEVIGLDASAEPSPEVVAFLKDALATYGVVVLRDQRLDDEDDQVRLSKAFGETVVPWLHAGERDTFSRRREISKRPAYTGRHPSCVYWVNSPDDWDNPDDGFAQDWHSDLSYLQIPLHYSFLYAITAPDRGYETWFADQYAAYDGLDEDTKRRIERLDIGHDFKSAFPKLPGVLHPLVQTHPRSGRKALYGIPGYARGVPVGMGEEEGEALMRRLVAHLDEDGPVYRHVWRTGDLLIWDNRCVMHRRGPQIRGETRVLRRTVAADGHTKEIREWLLGL